MKYATAILVALASGCTADNPNFIGDGDGGVDSGGIRFDGGQHDLAKGGADLAGTTCADGQRRCGAGASEICINAMFTTDRMCPSMSMCHEGYCQPPAAVAGSQVGANCEMPMFGGTGPQENQCLLNLAAKLSCMPFFDPTAGGIVWRCDTEVGQGLPATPCTMGSQCRSGFCGSNGTCFRACQSDQDCPQTSQQQTRCQNVSIVVEGMQVDAQSCTPN
ncbi:MAG TPA: hypothetical protein VFF06_27025 [Polyangia bacterium]|nr:hypothetical protein [Polyangia bacterium]